MTRKGLVLFILCFLILGLAAWAAEEKPKNETVVTSDRMQRMIDRLENAPRPSEDYIVTKYITSPMPDLSLPATKDTAGFTYYDYQHNQMMRRQIANGTNNKRYFDWMYSPTAGDVVSGLRDVHYNAKFEAGGPTYGWLILYGGLASSTNGRGGYTGLDLLPDNRAVLCYHNVGDTTNTTLNVETSAGLGTWSIFDPPDSVPGGLAGGIWPAVAVQKNVTTPVYIHVGIQENQPSGAGIGGYTRCYQYFDSLKCQGPGTPEYVVHPGKKEPLSRYCSKVEDQMHNTNIFPVTSPISQKVALIWQRGTSRTSNDIFYVMSDSGGDDWINQAVPLSAQFPLTNKVQVTNYAAGGYTRHLYGEYAGVFDYNDNLHIVWVTYDGTDANTVTLWHYTDGLPASQRVRQVTTHTAPSYVDPGGFNLILSKMTLGVQYLAGPRYNWLYCLWSQFNGGDTSAAGMTNSELYVAVSSNSGLSWSQPVDITNTHTNGCAAGACRSEHWASLAERVDSMLHIQYVMDLDAGGVVMTEGIGTKNPIRYLRYPDTIQIPAIPSANISPKLWDYPTVKANNNGSVTETLEVANSGTATLYVKTDVPTATYVTLAPANYNIIEGGIAVGEVVTFSAAGLSDTILYDSIRVATNHGLLGGAETYVDTQWVYFIFLVTDSLLATEWDTVNTGTGGIKTALSNTGNIGHGDLGDSVHMFYNGKDYLFDCSPLLVTPQASASPDDTVAASWLHDRVDFFPESHLQVTKVDTAGGLWFSRWGITIATSSFAPMVRRLGNPYSWFWWWWTIEQKDVFFENERVIVKYIKLYKNPPPPWWRAISEPSPQPSVLFGIGADWDVPSDASGKNKGGYNTGTNLIYVYSDSSGFTSNYGGFYFYYASVDDGATHDTSFAPWAARVQRNATQMYPTRGYNDDSLFKYMSITGWSVEQDSSQDQNIIISALNPAKLSGRSDTALITAKYALVVSDAGLTGLLKPMCGNANRDDKVTVSDVVYLVNFLFKGGPKPFMYYANANGNTTIMVDDVVYLVNYLFKGGPKPKCNYPIALP